MSNEHVHPLIRAILDAIAPPEPVAPPPIVKPEDDPVLRQHKRNVAFERYTHGEDV